MSTDNDSSPVEKDFQKWVVPLVSLAVSIITLFFLLPTTFRFPAILLCIEAVCIYIMTKRNQPSIAGAKRGSYIYQDNARSIARFISIGIPFFLVGFWLGPLISISPRAAMNINDPNNGSAVQPADIYGTYEWQWAGENWYGRVTLAKQNDDNVISYARVGVIEKVVLPNESDKIHMNGMLLNLNDGNFIVDDKGIKINLSVQKTDRRTNLQQTETITGNLQQVICYAGTVYYGKNKNKGDMILVKYLSNVDTDVDNWFREPSPPWYDYVISK